MKEWKCLNRAEAKGNGYHFVFINQRTGEIALADHSIRDESDPSSTDDGLLLANIGRGLVEVRESLPGQSRYVVRVYNHEVRPNKAPDSAVWVDAAVLYFIGKELGDNPLVYIKPHNWTDNKNELSEYAARLRHPMFSSRDTLEQAYEYAQKIATASDSPAAVLTAVQVVVNTIAKELVELEGKK